MTLTDKEKIEEVLRIVNSNLEIGKVRGKRPDKKTTIVWLQDGMKAIKEILEKRSLTDEQGYQEALELDEEDRLVLLKKEEKLEAIKEIIEEWRRPIRIEDGRILGIEALNQIRKVLEK